MTETPPAPPVGEGWFVRLLRTISAATFVGGILGALIGGIGGRLAMRLLFLTTGETVRGAISDDGFEIGRFSLPDTAGLVVFGAVVGVVGALIYLALRWWLPAGREPIAFAAIAGLVMGANTVHAGGVDFTTLRPLWLAVLLFVAIPAAFGAAAGGAMERALRDDGFFRTGRLWIALAPLLTYLFPLLLFVLVPVLVGSVLVRSAATRWPAIVEAWRSPAATWTGRIAIAAVLTISVADLASDIARLT